MSTQLYETLELVFRGDAFVPVGAQAPLEVRFRHADGAEVVVPGFWDGGLDYRVRFCPELAGRWSWRVERALTGLDRESGAVDVEGVRGHGPVRVAERFHFAHADGTPFRPVGTTAYNWLHQDEPLFTQTVESIAEAGFDKLRFMVFPQAGGYVEHQPELLPFERVDGRWDVSRPVVAFFRRLDEAVRLLDAHGVEADVLVLNAYDRGVFGLNELTAEEDATYLRYLVARLAASPNVWWSLCNEFDQLERPAERWDRLGELLAEIDPAQHPRSIHNWVELYDNNQPWVTHASLQNGSVTVEHGRAGLYRDVYRKPVVLDEIKYEGDIPLRWGRLDARDLVHRFWVATVAGCYASHGESFVTESGSLHMVEGGRLRGDSPRRLGFLREVLESLRVPGLDPIDKWDDPEHVAGWPREQYLLYLGRSAPATWTFRLPVGSRGERPEVGDEFEVDIIDTWNMRTSPAGRTFRLTDVRRNEAFATDAAPLALPEGEAVALLVSRVRDGRTA